MNSRPSRSNPNHSIKTIMFEGLKKDKSELDFLQNQLKRFFDHDYKRTFNLYPPMVKRPKRYNRHAYYDDDEDSMTQDSNRNIESDDEEESAMKMDNDERYYLYKYFEAKQNELGQMLL